MKKSTKRLALNAQIIRVLQTEDLAEARGGSGTTVPTSIIRGGSTPTGPTTIIHPGTVQTGTSIISGH